MKKIALLLFCSFSIFVTGCSSESSINQDEASEVINAYLEQKPEFETTSFTFGELQFNNRKDREELENYRTLAEKGLIKLDLQEQKKRFLSKDSSITYLVTLTDKAAPLVLEQRKDRATVKAINYVLDEDKPVNFLKTNEKSAKVTVSLKKEETDFYPFLKKGSNSEFLTKTYKLRLKKEKGWEISN